MKRMWLVSVLACGLLCGFAGPLSAGGGHGAKAGGTMLMFKEKHKETYYNGKKKVFGLIAQLCKTSPKSKNVYSCPQGTKQFHVKHGTWTWWWSNGKTMAVRTYHKGHLQGESKAWFSTGQKRWVEHYAGGKRSGLRTVWFAKGAKKRMETYQQGALHGRQTLWWPNGAKSSEGEYANGERVGAWKSWYINGDIKEVINYIDGKRSGAYVLYRSICQPSGCASVKSVEGQYSQGKKDGNWSRWYFDAEGQKKSKLEIWKNGQRTL